MGPKANKQLVARFYEEVWANGNVEFADEVFAPDYERHDLRPTEAAPGPAGQAQIARAFREAFPDLQWRVDLLVAEDDFVAARWTATGTHRGRWGEVAPTGRRAEFSGVNIFRFGEDGKVAEIWNHRDDLGLAEQLGAGVYAGAPDRDSELRRRLRRLGRRLNLFDASRTDETPQGNTSGPPIDARTGSRRG